MQEEFLWSYVQNKDKIGRSDFLPLFGASLLAYLHESTPRTKRILLKVSGAQYLHRFYDVFPHEALLLLIRDGRDVVHSTINTWPQFRFWMACLRWKRAAEMSFYVQNKFKHEGRLFWCGRFEAAIQDPHEFVKQACEQLELDDSVYPWESIGNQPVMGSSSLNRRGNVRWEPVEKPEGFHPIGHWRQWSAYRRIVFKLIAGEMLTKLGYGFEDEW
jgi:protein-tyrosine sulfotransferase